ncbi:hypothetical protein JZ751_019944 [Albula glossodonta]|uniref:Uncharacterized protein n=1 Tax=Albula glossodonta TaxID=121402 RepID=A0A8T2N0E9_9TELE|nr:hypothetical protein JZ751_019944 [Albula glossodonta]
MRSSTSPADLHPLPLPLSGAFTTPTHSPHPDYPRPFCLNPVDYVFIKKGARSRDHAAAQHVTAKPLRSYDAPLKPPLQAVRRLSVKGISAKLFTNGLDWF